MISRRPLRPRFMSAPTTAAILACSVACLLLMAGTVHAADANTGPHPQSYPQQYIARMWQAEQGLPQNSVYDIVQDRQGYLWLATWGGLVRFDGERFRIFTSADIPGLGSGRIMSLCETRSGVLWIGTRDGALIRLEDGVTKTYTQREGLPGTLISSIREDAEGRVWVNTSGGVAQVIGAKLEAQPTHQGKPVTEFYLQARDGSMWFHSGRDVVRFGPDGSIATLPVFQMSGFLVHEARDGSVLIASNYQPRLVHYHKGKFAEMQLPAIKRRQWTGLYPKAVVLAMARDSEGELLLLTPAGFIRFADGRLSSFEPVPAIEGPGELPKVLSIAVDGEGNRWVGTLTTGLLRFRPAPLTAFGKDEGLSDSIFFSVFQDRDGRVWMSGESLHWLDQDGFHRFPGLKDIRAIAQTRDGDLWFGGSGGLYRWRSGGLSRFKIDAPAVSVILEDRDGTLWIIAPSYERPGGLYRFSDGKFDLVASDIHKVTKDRDGGLWLANAQGLQHVRGGITTLYKQNLSSVPDIHQDATGTLWIAEYGGGMWRFRDGKFKAITTKDGLPNNLPDAILGDGNGNLWVSSDRNIFRFSLKELNDSADGRISSISPVSYGLAEGMRSSECNSGSPGGWRTTDGRIWFPTLRGVVAIAPNAGNHLPPPVVVEEAWANKLMIAGDGHASIPPGNNTFDFRFTALSLSAPEKVRFKYRLEPFDKGWVDAATRRAAHYTNMAPGEYSFRVIAANSYGVWNEQGARVHFVLQPHYYQTNWFRTLCAAIFLALLWAAYQVRVRRLHHQFEMTLDARVAERTRIARELHDTLLQSAHGVLLRFQTVSHLLPDRPLEAKEKLDTAIEQTAEFITEARDEVQGLRDSTSQSNDLALAISTLGEALAAEPNGHRCAFGVAVEGEARDLHPIVRDEIYKIAAEALRNAFLHSEARQVEVEIRYDVEQFRLRVRDDGKGIDRAVLSAHGSEGHYGLRGMQERATLIGGKLTIWSEIESGSEVELRVPAKAARKRSWFSRKFATEA